MYMFSLCRTAGYSQLCFDCFVEYFEISFRFRRGVSWIESKCFCILFMMQLYFQLSPIISSDHLGNPYFDLINCDVIGSHFCVLLFLINHSLFLSTSMSVILEIL